MLRSRRGEAAPGLALEALVTRGADVAHDRAAAVCVAGGRRGSVVIPRWLTLFLRMADRAIKGKLWL